MADLNPSDGGKARSEKLSAEEKKKIAQDAANARWHGDVPRAVVDGILEIGELQISCSVVEIEVDGKIKAIRLLSEREFTKSLGGKRGGSHWKRKAKGDGANLPVFLSAMNLRPFIPKDLALALISKFEYLPHDGGGVAFGIDAEIIPSICDVFLKAREKGELHSSQEHIAMQAEIIVRSLAKVGIIALVDEATGYEDQRPKDALALLLKEFVTNELTIYAKSFPLTYFKEICRLRGIQFREDMKLPKYFGHLTNNYVYSRLAPGVLEELQKNNPIEKGRRKYKNYHFLTQNIGHPKLLQHLGSIITLLKLSKTTDEFESLLNKIHPLWKSSPLFAPYEND